MLPLTFFILGVVVSLVRDVRRIKGAVDRHFAIDDTPSSTVENSRANVRWTSITLREAEVERRENALELRERLMDIRERSLRKREASIATKTREAQLWIDAKYELLEEERSRMPAHKASMENYQKRLRRGLRHWRKVMKKTVITFEDTS